jgi:predicted Fe-Mo cluster-binding NifX family protein
MKVAVTSTGNILDSEVSSVFGRCPYFIIVDMENGEITGDLPVENPAKNERGGAGIKAAQFIANSEVNALISGAVGPNAFDILKQVGIKVYKLKAGTVKDNLKLLDENQLEEIAAPATGGPGAGGRGMGRGGMGRRG